MRKIERIIKCGDCANVLLDYPDSFFDLIVTSPLYADCRGHFINYTILVSLRKEENL